MRSVNCNRHSSMKIVIFSTNVGKHRRCVVFVFVLVFGRFSDYNSNSRVAELYLISDYLYIQGLYI